MLQPPFPDADALWQEIRALLSAERLRPYRQRADRDPLGALARYLWNMGPCEALYPSLQGLEIALRNTLHQCLVAKTRNPFWWDDPSIRLSAPDQESISGARGRLAEAGKRYESGQMVAELRFGFWSGLLAREYEHGLLLPIVKDAFPHTPARLRTRKELAARCWNARTLRNRAFHYEPIWHYGDLQRRHDDILEAIGWISPTQRALAAAVDRFDGVWTQGWQPYRHLIEDRLLAKPVV